METTLIIKIVLAIIFTLSVVAKLTGKTKSTFEQAGYSANIMYTIAVAEVIFTIGLFTPFELLAALGLLAIMGGAILTLYRQHVKASKYSLALVATFLLIALVTLHISSAPSPTEIFAH